MFCLDHYSETRYIMRLTLTPDICAGNDKRLFTNMYAIYVDDEQLPTAVVPISGPSC